MPNSPKRKSPSPRRSPRRSPARNGIVRSPSRSPRRSPTRMRAPSPMRVSRTRSVLIQNMSGGRRANINIHNLVSSYNYLRTTPNGLNVYMRKR